MKGFIISIEGTDGSGKHTQQQLLSEDLKTMGYKVFDQSFPNYASGSAAPIKMYLEGEFEENGGIDAYQASALYAVDRLCTYKKTIKPHYENGEIVLFDRYVQSNFIHQCSRIADESERNTYLSWIEDLEYGKFELPKPDVTFFIEMPVEKSFELAVSRGKYKAETSKDILEEDFNYLKNAYKTGLELAKRFGWTIIHCIDKNGNLKHIEDIHAEIMSSCLKILKANYTD